MTDLRTVQDSNETETSINNDNKCRCITVCLHGIPRRYMVIIFLFFGLFNVYAMRVNLSVGIEPMSCQFKWNNNIQGYILSAFFIGYIFGNIPGGYIASKIGGKIVFSFGVLCTGILTLLLPLLTSGSIYGIKGDRNITCKCDANIADDWCFIDGYYNNSNECNNINNICNYDSNIISLFILRVFMGLFESVTFPALYGLINNWTHKSERSRAVSVSFSGMYLGNILGFLISSYFINLNNYKYGGWIYCFYSFSIIAIIWFILFLIFVYDSPLNDPCITQYELNYLINKFNSVSNKNSTQYIGNQQRSSFIQYNVNIFDESKTQNGSIEFNAENNGNIASDLSNNNLESSLISPNNGNNNNNNNNNNDKYIPWFYLMFHPVALTLYFAHFSYCWSYYTLLTELPTFLNKELNFNMSSSGIISVLPFIGQFISSMISSYIIDKLINNDIISRRNARIIMQFCGTILPGIFLVLCGYLDNITIIVILLTLSSSFMGFTGSGFSCGYPDVSPTLSNIMYGISNTYATIPGIISPILTGLILGNNPGKTQWLIVFYIAFIVFIIGFIPYIIFIKANIVPNLNYKHK